LHGRYTIYTMFMAIAKFFNRPGDEADDTAGSAIPVAGWTEVFSTLDVNGDNRVSFDELYAHILRHPNLVAFLDSAVLRLGEGGEESVITSSSGGGIMRALKESALTNKVQARRSTYHKPWQHMAKNFHAVHVLESCVRRTHSEGTTSAS
jgi:hypothetical protein